MIRKNDLRKARCPQCRREFTYDPADEPKWLPFCSDRCKWIDLGRWLNEEFRVSREIKSSDEQNQD